MEAATWAAKLPERASGALLRAHQSRRVGDMPAQGPAGRPGAPQRRTRRAAACAENLVADAAVSRERERIAAEIHDNLVQSFLSVIAALREAPPSTAVTTAMEMARGGIRSARNCARALRSLSFSSLALPKMVEGMTRRVVPRQIRLHVDVQADWPQVAAETAEALYRCVQEAVSNSVKHASCACLSVRFSSERSRAKVEVIDDGVGCELRSCLHGDGLGLFVMRDRMSAVGGEVRFASAPAQGTSVILLAPTVRNDEPQARTACGARPASAG